MSTHQKGGQETGRPRGGWPIVQDQTFRPGDEIHERPDGLYRGLRRDGAPGWNLLVRNPAVPIGWSLVAEAQPTLRAAQSRAEIHEHARRVVESAPPPSPALLAKVLALVNGDPGRETP